MMKAVENIYLESSMKKIIEKMLAFGFCFKNKEKHANEPNNRKQPICKVFSLARVAKTNMYSPSDYFDDGHHLNTFFKYLYLMLQWRLNLECNKQDNSTSHQNELN